MIIYTGQMRVKPENQAQYEEKMRQYCEHVRANELGTVFYESSKSTNDPEQYIVIEIYRDVEAFEAHKNSDAFKRAISEIPPLTTDTIVTRYETVSNT